MQEVPEKQPWRQAVVAEIVALLERMTEDRTQMWATGEAPAGSPITRVTEDFVGVQYASWFENGCYRGEGQAWLAGSRQAAEHYKGQGIRWTVDHIIVLPRSEEEAAVSYRINHWWGDSEREPARALFLESWVKREGKWHLKRHTAEKA